MYLTSQSALKAEVLTELGIHDVTPLPIPSYSTPNQPYGYDHTFQCALKRLRVGLEYLLGTDHVVIAIENGIYKDHGIHWDFCAVILYHRGTYWTSYYDKSPIRVPVKEEYIPPLRESGWSLTAGDLYHREYGYDAKNWSKSTVGIDRKTQISATITYVLNLWRQQYYQLEPYLGNQLIVRLLQRENPNDWTRVYGHDGLKVYMDKSDLNPVGKCVILVNLDGRPDDIIKKIYNLGVKDIIIVAEPKAFRTIYRDLEVVEIPTALRYLYEDDPYSYHP